jgi:hypothetical protein
LLKNFTIKLVTSKLFSLKPHFFLSTYIFLSLIYSLSAGNFISSHDLLGLNVSLSISDYTAAKSSVVYNFSVITSSNLTTINSKKLQIIFPSEYDGLLPVLPICLANNQNQNCILSSSKSISMIINTSTSFLSSQSFIIKTLQNPWFATITGAFRIQIMNSSGFILNEGSFTGVPITRTSSMSSKDVNR